MTYKIDTKDKFDIITPQIPDFNYTMAEELITLCKQMQKSDKSVIIDFINVASTEERLAKEIETLHTTFYNSNLSFAICNIKANLKPVFSDELNIVPTLAEAIDIISMEGLERDLLGEF